jgi:hypothetical protein
LNAGALWSWTPEESEVESGEYQDDADICGKPFPESVSEEQNIYTDYDDCHRYDVKHDRNLAAHFRLLAYRLNRHRSTITLLSLC